MNYGQSNNGGGGFAALINPVSLFAAICIMIAFTGKGYRACEPTITMFVFREYGDAAASIAPYLSFPLIALGILLLARVAVAFLLNLILVKLIGRLFR